MPVRDRLACAFGAALLFLSAVPGAAQTLVPAGSTWRYSDSGANLGTAWRTAAVSDATWPSGPAQLGYGDGDEATVLGFGDASNRHITSYFRRTFDVASPSSVAALTLRVLRDDGCVVYLNGVEIWRSNMPAGTISYTTRATAAIGGADEAAWHEVPVDPAQLVAGANLIAVEVHQQSPTSTDVSFDLELRATPAATPSLTVTLTSPANGAVINSANPTLTAAASSPVGLQTATLLIGTLPRTLAFSGPSAVLDAQITADSPTTPAGSGASINVDGQAPHAHGLLKIPALIGSGLSQVPAGSRIATATLTLNCTNAGQPLAIYRLTQDWNADQATWNQRSAGVPWGAAGGDGAASHAGVALAGNCTATGLRTIDLTRFVQEWSSGSPNYGVVMTDTGTDGIDFTSSESSVPPVLSVTFSPPLVPVGTIAVGGVASTIEFPVPPPDAPVSLIWNVEVADTTGMVGRAPADFAVTFDVAAPDEPRLVSPANGATGVDPSGPMVATVSTPGGGTVSATADLRTASGAPFTIIVLPDTQHYSEAFPAIFTAQTQWIVANREARNIVFVTHEGDIVEHNSNVTEWERANASLSILDGAVPYGMAPGNHDLPSTLYNQYFPFTRYQPYPWYGGHYQNLNDNNYQLFSGGGIDFVAVHLTFCPPQEAVDWARSIFAAYPDRIGMMTTHGYLNESAQRTVGGCPSTQYLWDSLGAVTPNLHFMLSGHVHDESRRADVANGHTVFQMLADYQARASGGEGWLRIMRFVPAENRVYVQTYSPWLDRYETDANSEFTLDFPMSGSFTSSAPVAVTSGANATFVPAGLEPSTTYDWRVTVTNQAGRSRTGPTWRFTTGAGGPVNRPPVASAATLGVTEDTAAAVIVSGSDPDGDAVIYEIVTGPSHGTLTGSAPALTYQPAANYSGADSFTFRVSDGVLWSAAATVNLAIAAVNDAPVALGEAYSIAAGATLTVAAPGVLANDADVEGAALLASVAVPPAHGTLALAASGGFTYTSAAGYSGPDSFTYRASDGGLASAPVAVDLTITGSTPATLFTASFAATAESFTYLDNTFRGAIQSSYATGSYVSSGGFSGGALRIYLGGINNNTINGMSGGWRRTFAMSSAAAATLTFRYRLDQGPDYESDERSEVLASLDGVLVTGTSVDYVARVTGNGNGGASIDTGWRQVTIDLGMLPAGTHALTLGGYNSRKNTTSERTTIWIDDVNVTIR